MENEKDKDTNKDTNPKDNLGVRKVPIHCVSCAVIMEIGLGMMEGGRKYGTHNYREMGVLASVYYDAAMRHLMAYWEGEDIDFDSGLHHVTKAMSCLSVLRDSQLMGNCKDDRPIRLPDGLGIKGLNEKASKIIDRYPDSKKPFTELSQENEHEKGKLIAKDTLYCIVTSVSIRLCHCQACLTRRINDDVP